MASVRKRVRARVGREPLITWVADYKDGAGKRHVKTLPSKREAQQWLSQALVEVRMGKHTPSHKSITVAEAAKRWLDHCRAEQRESHNVALL